MAFKRSLSVKWNNILKKLTQNVLVPANNIFKLQQNKN